MAPITRGMPTGRICVASVAISDDTDHEKTLFQVKSKNSVHDLANQKVCYFQMPLDIEKSGEQDKEQSKEWLVNTDPDYKLLNWPPERGRGSRHLPKKEKK